MMMWIMEKIVARRMMTVRSLLRTLGMQRDAHQRISSQLKVG